MIDTHRIDALIEHFCQKNKLPSKAKLDSNGRCILLVRPEGGQEQIIIINYDSAADYATISLILCSSKNLDRKMLLRLLAENNYLDSDTSGIFAYDEISRALLLKRTLYPDNVDKDSFAESLSSFISYGDTWRAHIENASFAPSTNILLNRDAYMKSRLLINQGVL